MNRSDDTLLPRIARNVRDAAAHSRNVVQVGPFAALLEPSSDLIWLSYAVPTTILGDPSSVAEDIERLRLLFAVNQRVLRFEYVEDLWSGLASMLEEAGLSCQARQPLMACTPDSLRPVSAPGATAQVLDDTDEDATLGLFLGIQSAGFAGRDTIQPPSPGGVERLRQGLREGRTRCALARLDGVAAGAGATVPHAGIAEMVGIATLPALRRRGVAATLSSALAHDHFARGGTLVWLSAGDSAAQATYQRIGFRLVGTQLNYNDGQDVPRPEPHPA